MARTVTVNFSVAAGMAVVLVMGFVALALACGWFVVEGARYVPAVVGVAERVARWSCLGLIMLIFGGFAACGLYWATREETNRIGNREEMQQTLTRLIPAGTEASEARRRLEVRSFTCDPVTHAEDADWPKPGGNPGYEPLPAGADVSVCTRQNDLLVGLAFWRVALVLSDGRISRVIVLANFRALL